MAIYEDILAVAWVFIEVWPSPHTTALVWSVLVPRFAGSMPSRGCASRWQHHQSLLLSLDTSACFKDVASNSITIRIKVLYCQEHYQFDESLQGTGLHGHL
ncbi:hypothetical protein ACP4OV_025034 [Aristida adscensionis]